MYETCVYTVKAVYRGLAIEVDDERDDVVLYFSDEGQGQVGELELKPKLNSTADVTARIIDSETKSRPQSLAIDTVNR